MLQVSPAEAVVFHLLDTGGVHAVPQDGTHHQADSAFALAAPADDEQHLLGPGGGQQAVAQVLLQGGDVLRF